MNILVITLIVISVIIILLGIFTGIREESASITNMGSLLAIFTLLLALTIKVVISIP